MCIFTNKFMTVFLTCISLFDMELIYGISNCWEKGINVLHCFCIFCLQNSHTKLSLALFIKLDAAMKVCEKPSVVYAGVGASYVST